MLKSLTICKIKSQKPHRSCILTRCGIQVVYLIRILNLDYAVNHDEDACPQAQWYC